jgi:hypothetical protein
MKSLLSLITLLSVFTLASCSTTSQVSLDYASGPGHIKPGAPEYSTRLFSDQRGLGPLDLGTVRTQIGTPLEHVQTRVPISEVVTNAFGYGLQARGMLTRPRAARFIVTGDILDLYCQMLVRPYGYARVRITILEAGTGQIVHSKVYTGERGGTAYLPGSGSPVPMLRDLVSGALQDAVDRALDDPTFRSQTRAGGMPYDIPSGYGPGPGPAPAPDPGPYSLPPRDFNDRPRITI